MRVPLSALPSSWVYRGALAAIVVAFILVGIDSYRWVSAGGPQPRTVATTRPVLNAQGTPAVKPTPTAAPQDRLHTVAEGETLSTIAAQYELATDTLASYNSLADRELIKVGQVLKIPPK